MKQKYPYKLFAILLIAATLIALASAHTFAGKSAVVLMVIFITAPMCTLAFKTHGKKYYQKKKAH